MPFSISEENKAFLLQCDVKLELHIHAVDEIVNREKQLSSRFACRNTLHNSNTVRRCFVKAGFVIGAVDPLDLVSGEKLDEGTATLLAEEKHVALPPLVQDPQQWISDTIDVISKGYYEGKTLG